MPGVAGGVKAGERSEGGGGCAMSFAIVDEGGVEARPPEELGG